MDLLTPASLARYWSDQAVAANLIALLNILGASLLGLIVGYERTYHGRAAGMRTFGLVCMASCALVVLAGAPNVWFGGANLPAWSLMQQTDPTRIIQGIVTGIGFLGAGVIMRDGMNISGLTTAASIWAASAIGILVGVGFYATAILLTLLATALMLGVNRLEQWLPAKPAIAITLRFQPGFSPQESVLRNTAKQRGYDIITGSLQIHFHGHQQEWRYIAVASDKHSCVPISVLAQELSHFEGVDAFDIAYARN